MENWHVVEAVFLTRGRCEISSAGREVSMGCLATRTGLTVVVPAPDLRVIWSQLLNYDGLKVYYPRSIVELPR
jgi:hypothetical protein